MPHTVHLNAPYGPVHCRVECDVTFGGVTHADTMCTHDNPLGKESL